MEDFLGSGQFGGKESMNMMCWVHMTMTFVTLVLVVIILLLQTGVIKSGFQNMPDYGIGQRGDVIASLPAHNEESMRQKVDRWTKESKSQLTGSRDQPVFFQDYNVEMERKKNATAVSNTREGFEGGRADEELELALSGRN